MKHTRTCLAILAALALVGCGRAGGDLPAPDNAVAGEPFEMPSAPDARQTAADPSARPVEPSKEAVSACLIQNGKAVTENAIRAVGTEPFWAAGVNGRCVTYSTPEDQEGTRVWTRFEGTAERGVWTGALDGQPFVMTTTPQERCSDGMSDKSYPIAVTLEVRGERRTGCAERR